MAKISVTPTIVLSEFILFSKKVSVHKVGKKNYKNKFMMFRDHSLMPNFIRY